MKSAVYKAVVDSPRTPATEELFFDGSKRGLLEGLKDDSLKALVKAVDRLSLNSNMVIVEDGVTIGSIQTVGHYLFCA